MRYKLIMWFAFAAIKELNQFPDCSSPVGGILQLEIYEGLLNS